MTDKLTHYGIDLPQPATNNDIYKCSRCGRIINVMVRGEPPPACTCSDGELIYPERVVILTYKELSELINGIISGVFST